MKEKKHEKRKKPKMILNIQGFLQGFIHYDLQEKICNTLKDINTRKYTSLEEASSKEEEGCIFTGGGESRVN